MMIEKPKATVRNTDAARAVKAARNRALREQNRARLNAEMDAVEAEVRSTGNLRIASVAEICRRAGLSEGIINKGGYVDLRKIFSNRLKSLKAPQVSVPPKKKRKPAEIRAMEWKAMFEAVVEQLRVVEVDLLLCKVRIDEALVEVEPPDRGGNVVEIRP